MTGVQIHIRHILCTLLAPDPLASFTQFCGDPVRPVCASAFFKLFFDSLFQMRFPILKSFPITEPGSLTSFIGTVAKGKPTSCAMLPHWNMAHADRWSANPV
jgi:hypothetical protein